MNKNYVFAGIGVVGIVVGIIVLVMMNTHPSLAEIVENKDCQEFGKFDHRMDETYGYDIKKMKAELNISDELFSKAVLLGIDCSFDAVKSMYGNDSSDEDDTKISSEYASIQLKLVVGIIQNRDCEGIKRWVDSYGYSGDDIGLDSKTMGDIISYEPYCITRPVANESGIDVRETWNGYSEWDSNYRALYSQEIEEALKNTKSNLEVIQEAVEIINEKDCKQFVEWFEDNIDHVCVLDTYYDDKFDLYTYWMYCEDPNTVLNDNGIDIEEKWDHHYRWDE